jgi:mannonate dehydratase
MKETWRWFGPDDPVTLDHVRQAGATGIVTALHHVPPDVAWTREAVAMRKAQIAAGGLVWSVVESIPVTDAIKTRGPGWRAAVDVWIASLRAVAAEGIGTVCYNFMPVVDWTRTDLRHVLPTSGIALRFDMVEMAAFDVLVLRRAGAEADHPPERVRAAEARLAAMTPEQVATLERTIIAGLPGTDLKHDKESFRRALARYDAIAPADLAASLAAFLTEVVPVAEELGVRLAIHPDDPPFRLFGLPRVVSTPDDARALLAAAPSPANGLTFCVGSYGARADNDVPAMARAFAPHVHFAHLRDVTRAPDGSFHEAEHLEGDNGMVAVVAALLEEEDRRVAAGRADAEIPLRPDHGHLLIDDVTKKTNPGYSAIGRLKGLAELRGVMRGLRHAWAGGGR